MKPEEIESARKALADIGRIVAERDSLRRAVKEMRENENEMARKHAAEVDARIAEIKALEAELAARPVVESEAARKLRRAMSYWMEVGGGARRCVIALKPTPETPSDVDLSEAIRAFRDSAPPQSAPPARVERNVDREALRELASRWERHHTPPDVDFAAVRMATFKDCARALRAALVAAPRASAAEPDVDRELARAIVAFKASLDCSPISLELHHLLCAGSVWLAAPHAHAAEPDDYTRLAVLHGEAAFDEYEIDPHERPDAYADASKRLSETRAALRSARATRQRGEPVSRLTPLERAAVELAEADARAFKKLHVSGNVACWDKEKYPEYIAARDRYVALRDGEKASGAAPVVEESTFDSKAVKYPDEKTPPAPMRFDVHATDQYGVPVDLSGYTATAALRTGNGNELEVTLTPNAAERWTPLSITDKDVGATPRSAFPPAPERRLYVYDAGLGENVSLKDFDDAPRRDSLIGTVRLDPIDDDAKGGA